MASDAECVSCGQRFVLTGSDEAMTRTPPHHLPERVPGLGRPHYRQSDQPCPGVGTLLAVRVKPGTVKAARP